jgi:hypothetical protein
MNIPLIMYFIPCTFQSVISHSINPLHYQQPHFGQFTNSIYLVASFQLSFLPIQLILYIFYLLSNFFHNMDIKS